MSLHPTDHAALLPFPVLPLYFYELCMLSPELPSGYYVHHRTLPTAMKWVTVMLPRIFGI